MGSVLVIVESPSKARTIKQYLGSGYVVRATAGHIIDLAKGRGVGLGVDIDDNFKPKYTIIEDKKDSITAIKSASQSASEILIASDPDREGEAIAFHVASILKGTKVPVRRVKFHEITKKAIQKAIAKPEDLDKDLYDAQQARRVLDRIVGFMVSPYLMRKLGDDAKSAGRVQSVALRLIVERELEIEAFKPEEFWTVTASLAKTPKGQVVLASYPKRVITQKQADKLVTDLKNSSYEVIEVVSEEKKRPPCPPLVTSKLIQDASYRFKFSASKTQKLAQELYEAGHITYLRSDSTRCSPQAVAAAREWIDQNGHEKPAKPNVYKNKDAAQDAHEAIRPTDVNLTADLLGMSADHRSIYRLVWARFIGSQMKPALYDTVSVSIKASEGPELKAEGRTLKYPGWLAVCDEFEKKTKDVTLPLLQVKDVLILVPPKVKAQKKSTKPPSRYGVGPITKELERKGIGRPSTYAAIISTLLARKYVTEKSNVFYPSDTGRQVVGDLKKFFSFMKYQYTAEMEAQLDKIAEGKLGYVPMLETFYDAFRKEFQKARASESRETDIPCPVCGGKTVLKFSKWGYFAGCIKHPDCKGAIGVRLEGDTIVVQSRHEPVPGVKCPDCGGGMYKRDGEYGPWYSCADWPRCKGKRKVPFGKKCIDCGGELYLTVFDGVPKLACMEYRTRNCRHVEDVPEGVELNWSPPDKVVAKKLSKKEMKVLRSR